MIPETPTLEGLLCTLENSKAHTYSSENADLYRGFDNGQRRAAEWLAPIAAKLWELHDRIEHDRSAHLMLTRRQLNNGSCPKCALAAILGERP